MNIDTIRKHLTMSLAEISTSNDIIESVQSSIVRNVTLFLMCFSSRN